MNMCQRCQQRTWVEEWQHTPVQLHVPCSLRKPGDTNNGTDRAVLGRLLGSAARGGDDNDSSGLDVVGRLNGRDGGGGGAIQLITGQELGLGEGKGCNHL